MKCALIITLFLYSTLLNLLFGQIQDIQLSEEYDYNILKEKIKNCKSDTTCLLQNIKAYVKKAKSHNDTFNLISGYKYYIKHTKRTQYKDSVVNLLKESKNKKQFLSELSEVYYVLGGIYYDSREYDNALTYYLKSKALSDNTDVDFNIALIKSRLGYYQEALTIFKHAKNEFIEKENYNDYLISLYAISDAYRHLQALDSAILYNNLGLKESVHYDKQELIPYFKLNEACINYDNFAYQKSYDSLKKVRPKFINNKDLSNLAMCYYFMGMSAKQLNQTKDFVNSFVKLDSITYLINDLEPEFRNGYEALIDHFHKNEDVANELKYVRRLLEIDNVLNKRYKNLTQRLNKEYNTPILLKDRDRLVLSLQKEKKSYLFFIFFCASLILLLLIWILYKRRHYRKKLQELLEEDTTTPKKDIVNTKSDSKSLNIKEEIVLEVITKLNDFEKNKGFLNSQIKINSLANELNTNANYLSKIINHHKGKSFSNYLNDLRITHCISRLKSDPVFRKYTVKAIAEESGFNSAESFSKSFTKITEIKPSLFIKELEKRE
ncbi:helix-turn-helix domain-containing protein [Formosa sp. A9]|uniref:helix-turn-helix domain-containing protein n=1 Tax=Formosa sp. A9 TaxID=3442641 RepID=UPI003EB863F5